MADQRLSIEGLPRDIAHAITAFGNACFECGAFSDDVDHDVRLSLVETQVENRRRLANLIKAALAPYPADPAAAEFIGDLRRDLKERT